MKRRVQGVRGEGCRVLRSVDRDELNGSRGLRLEGLGFGIQERGVRVDRDELNGSHLGRAQRQVLKPQAVGERYKVDVLGVWVQGLGFRVSGFGLRVLGLRVEG